jgi:hypothetical protein
MRDLSEWVGIITGSATGIGAATLESSGSNPPY